MISSSVYVNLNSSCLKNSYNLKTRLILKVEGLLSYFSSEYPYLAKVNNSSGIFDRIYLKKSFASLISKSYHEDLAKLLIFYNFSFKTGGGLPVNNNLCLTLPAPNL